MNIHFVVNRPLEYSNGVLKKQFDLFGIGSAIAGIAGAGGSIAAAKMNYKSQQETNAMNYRIAQETNQANRDLYDAQFRDQVRMFNMQNAYNDPSAARQRLAAAGLNPALNMGDAGQAGEMSVPSASPAVAPTMQAPQYSDIGGSIMNAVTGISSSLKDLTEASGISTDNQYRAAQNEAELNKAKAQIDEIVSNTNLNKQQKENLIELKEGINLQNYLTRETMSDVIQQKELQTKQMSIQNLMMDEQTKNIRQDTILKRAQTAFQIHEDSRQFKRLAKELQKMDAEISLMASQGVLNSYSCANVFYQTIGQVISNRQAALIMPFVYDIYKSDMKTARNKAFRSTIESYNPFSYDNPLSDFSRGAGQIARYLK